MSMGLVEEVRKLRSEGLTYRVIASRLNISNTKVSNILNNKFKGHFFNKYEDRRNKAISMYKSGSDVSDIATSIGVSRGAVYTYLKDVQFPKRGHDTVELIIKQCKEGYTAMQIAENINVSFSQVYRILKKEGLKCNVKETVNEKKQLVIELRGSGYYIHEVMNITGLARQTVVQYSAGHRFDAKPIQKKIKIKVMPRKKKKVESRPSALDQRAVLGKGVPAGQYSTEVKLREDRNEGRKVSFLYSDLGDTPVVPITILVKDENISDDVAIENWCKKFKKKSWKKI